MVVKLWSEYKARFTSWQLTLLLTLGVRSILTDQTPSEIGFAWMLMNLLGGTINAFWTMLYGAADIVNQKLIENKKRMESLQNKLYLIEKQAYEKESQLRADYKDIVLEIVGLYSDKTLKNELINGVQAVNPLLASRIQEGGGLQEKELVNQNMEDMQKIARQLLILISKNPPLPNTRNGFAQKLLAVSLGGLVTSVIAIELSMATFNPDNLNWNTVGSFALIMYSLYAVIYHGYRKGLKEWRTYFNSQWLGLKDSIKRGCRGTFSK